MLDPHRAARKDKRDVVLIRKFDGKPGRDLPHLPRLDHHRLLDAGAQVIACAAAVARCGSRAFSFKRFTFKTDILISSCIASYLTFLQ